MTHYPRKIACEIEIDKNFNLDRAIYTLSEFLSIKIETAILVAGWLYIQQFYLLVLRRQTIDTPKAPPTTTTQQTHQQAYFPL
jgi:hypothetical protein